jgi:2',3'-cyclic-nucleotide 2'-phosphodiesterase (5'-nucleotidase family)
MNTHIWSRRATASSALIAVAAAAACASAPRMDAASAATITTSTDTVSFVLMGTTDVHGRLYNHDYYTGQSTVRRTIY